MDDTTHSKNADAAATRKRRSSILKNQRPPRTPFCDLEFNVATPTEVSKSRRVSFSRRTGVAEFATNEATNTWKNFYEEHNKSLESSGNDSNPNNKKQSVTYLGKRIFDQQFEEVEAMEFIGSVKPGMNMSMSIANINFTEQLECTDSKLTAPRNKLELSTFTEQRSKLFGDDLLNPFTGEVSGHIDINFSTVQLTGENDDLDEIQKDLQQKKNVICHGPVSDKQNLSEYIEVDLNMTHIAINNVESDMSITDTIANPEVQNVSKSASIDKKVSISKDWIADKENIAINPYVAPRESINFAVNEEPDKVLVFDGKKLIVQTENPKIESFRHSLMPSTSDKIPQRKTIVINCDDDLPHFIQPGYPSNSEPPVVLDNISTARSLLNETQNRQRTIMYGDDSNNMSVTQAIPNVIPTVTEKRNTILFHNDTGNMSITEAIPFKVISKEKRQTIVYENCDVSITQAIPVTLLSNDNNEKRKTIVYENDACNLSMTQALPANIIPNPKRRTILYEDDTENVSLTQAIPNNVIIDNKEKSRKIVYDDAGNFAVTKSMSQNDNLIDLPERRRTVVFENDTCNISVTQALPSNIILSQQLNATTYDKDCNMSMTQAIRASLLPDTLETNRRRTVVHEGDTGNVSITQAVPSNQVMQGLAYLHRDIALEDTVAASENLNVTNGFYTKKRRTILFENDDRNMSITQALNLNHLLPGVNKQQDISNNPPEVINTGFNTNKRRTIVFENDDGNMSMTQALNLNHVLPGLNKQQDISNNLSEVINTGFNTNKRRTIVFENDDGNMSMTQAINLNHVLPGLNKQQEISNNPPEVINTGFNTNKRRTIVFENDDGNMSMTQGLNLNHVLPGLNKQQDNSNNPSEVINKRRTIVFENDGADISVTQAVPLNQVIEVMNEKRNDLESIEAINSSLNEAGNKRKTIGDNEEVNVSQAININQFLLREDQMKSVTHEELEVATNAALHHQNDPSVGRRKTIIYDDDEGDMSMTQAIHENDVLSTEHKKRTIVFEDVDAMLENKELFMEIDKVTATSPERYDVKTLDISMTGVNAENSKRKTIVYEQDNDMSITQTIHQNDNPKMQDKRRTVIFDETANTTLSKPIPAGLSTFDNELFDRSHDKNISKHYATLMNVTNTMKDVLIYQAVTTPDKGDSSAVEPIPVFVEKEQASADKTTNEMNTTSQDSTKMSTEIEIPIEQKNEQVNVQTDKSSETSRKPNLTTISINVPSEGAVEILSVKPKRSILNDLLDMSHSSLDGDLEDNNLMTMTESEQPSLDEVPKPEPLSSDDTLFYITNDDEGQTGSSENNTEREDNILKIPQICQSHLPIEYKDEENLVIVDDVQNKLAIIKSVLKDESPQQKNIHDSEMEYKESLEKSVRDFSPQTGKSFKMANDTNELLEMLSDFTDKRKSKHLEPHLEEKEVIPEPITLKENFTLENKDETKRRLSFVPKRQSIALTREDFLNNLSMAGAALRKSAFEIDDTDDIEDTATETPQQDISSQQDTSRKKSVRLSTEVVKTLHFDEDDSLNETRESVRAYDTLHSPLKKTAFGEVSYMKETTPKAKVIPEYLMEVSNGIKELMDDLVKPMADEMPFEATSLDKSVRRCPSTCSTQIQANLLTSSQIDLNTELYSNTESMHDIDDKKSVNQMSSIEIITDAVNRSMSRALKSPIKSIMTVSHAEKSTEINSKPVRQSQSPSKYSESNKTERVLIFDHVNPLNNVLLDPPELVEAHRYNPIQSVETISSSEASHSPQLSINETENAADSEGISIQYRMENTNTIPSKYAEIGKTDTQSFTNSAKSSTDQWTDPKTVDNLKDTEVNTVIAMKGNKELLEASSSLTLVDDALYQSNIELDSSKTAPQEDGIKSTINVIYQVEESLPEKLDSDFTSTDEVMLEMPVKSKKRVYSPSKRDRHKHCTLSSLDVTPKPASKIQKRSTSPEYSETTKSDYEKGNHLELDQEENIEKNVINQKPGTTITVQQVITTVDNVQIKPPSSNTGTIVSDAMDLDCHVSETREEAQDKEVSDPNDCCIIEPLSPNPSQCNVIETVSSDICSSLSSKNMRDDTSQISSPSQVSRTSDTSRFSKTDWLAESCSSGMVSMKLTESDTGVDIITKIDMMPFMGSHDCEWESSSEDKWSFCLLHSRLRLTVRFCPTTRVRHNTRVLNVALETLHQDKRNTLAVLCVNFGAELMRHMISRGCSTADEVPKLVRKLAAAARVAERWARAMHDARARLAYTLTSDGWLQLKVANTSLRTVWEVSMRLELQVDSAHSAPWPRACDVRVTSVLRDVTAHGVAQPAEREVERVLASTPHDWGHVPRTVWKIFKYLKHKRGSPERS